MSRIGQVPVPIPDGVNVDIAGQQVTAKGKLGEMSAVLMPEVEVLQEEQQIVVRPRQDTLRARQMWGTARTVVNNLVIGVAEGFKKDLEINGVGYRAQVKGKNLVLQLGFSHDVEYPIPEGIKIQCADQTHISIEGANRQLVGQVAAEIRGHRPPEPYKGKGVKYADEQILRKEGKKK
ncbi:MAG: 50S ribosomal protein L6 [Rhodospirillaceae bacterium]|jgi:large subunit ribosomal protein L6